ncbi:glycoside hydrolase family 15 protein [Streptomyces sp. NPDC046985]|uniref:glycoside hydrolase family 15 protein n=1 Tax=Streptomyces sp. NPDC046985 TaxID=3155377 RepID=UPI0033FBD60A
MSNSPAHSTPTALVAGLLTDLLRAPAGICSRGEDTPLIPSLNAALSRPRPARRAGRIEDHGFIGDLRTGALVDRDGGIAWLCPQRFDAPAVFASLLGTEEHGLWRLGPAAPDGCAPAADRRRYLAGTLILESTWITRDGTVQVLDFMPPTGQAPQLVRIVRGVSGRVPMHSLLRARPGYGLHTPQLDLGDGRASVDLGTGRLWLEASAPTRAADGDLLCDFTVCEGESLALTLSWTEGHDVPPPPVAPAGLLKGTQDFWRDWTARSTYRGPYREAVERSLITLKALTYAPTGAIAAAATTSLPEEIGGVRNWDYRYCWLRDSAMIVEAFLRCGSTEEARAWIDWLRTVMGDRPEDLQIMYGVGGERTLVESALGWLPGFMGSAPVRIGNAAAGQLQLDVYGEVVGALYEAQLRDPALAPVVAPLVTDLVARLEEIWAQPDEGIWEIRGPRRQFVHSKVMAWTAVDRAVRLIEAGHARGPLARWRALREEIHAQVCEHGYDEERNTFTQYYGSAELDAALLQIALTGFLPPQDKRVVGTVEAVQRELSVQGGYLLRYHTEGARPGVDGLAGDEGAFLVCSGWLIAALALIGRVDEAEILTDGLLAARSDLGLLAEEWDPHLGRQLGNLPQGFSHLAVVLAALAVEPARAGGRTRVGVTA